MDAAAAGVLRARAAGSSSTGPGVDVPTSSSLDGPSEMARALTVLTSLHSCWIRIKITDEFSHPTRR